MSNFSDLEPAGTDKRALLADLLRRRAAQPQRFPLSFSQQRLWFLDQLGDGGSAYHIAAAWQVVQGSLDRAALELSLREVIRRQKSLRTTFATVDGEPVQVVAPSSEVALPSVDLASLPAGGAQAEALRIAHELAYRRFDLSRGPLFRVVLLHLEGGGSVIALAMHHIIADGWSIGLLIRELATTYEALAAGRPSPLPKLPIQYVDFAQWQRDWLRGDVLAGQLAYWRERLGGGGAVLELPTDRPRPAIQSFRGCGQPVALPPALREALLALGQRERVTLFMVLLAAFQVLLHRYTGQEQVTVGSPIAYRNRRELEGVIGFFSNTLVVRTDLSGQPTFLELLARVRAGALGDFSHQDVPFEKLVEALQPDRDLSRTPLFQVAFALQNTPPAVIELPELVLTPLEIERRSAKFDLTVELTEGLHGIAGTFDYNRDLFDRSTIRRAVEHFEVLLDGVLADPGRRITELPLLTATETAQVIREWNDTGKECPQQPMVHELFAMHAERQPETLAVVSRAAALTYGELDRRANQLAHHLRTLGVEPDALVAVCTDRTIDRVVGIVGVLKAGGAYVSIDPQHPRDRLAFLLEDARAPVLLTERRFLEVLPETAATVLCLDTDWGAVAGRGDLPPRPPRTGVTPDHLSYVVYTSGSTGKPKGVEIPHAGLMNLVRWHSDLYTVRPGDHGTQVASPAFDASIWELWPYLASGASLHIPDEETRLSSAGMIRWWDEEGITLAYLMTPLAEGVLEEKIPPGTDLQVRALIIGGDRLHRGPDPEVGFRLMNHYGPAEYTVTCTVVQVPPRGEERGLPTIGRAIDNTSIYLLDRHLQPVPVGVPGELYVAGIGLARGYLRRPDLTAEKFVPDPFAAARGEAGARMYRTADLVRWLPDGDMDFMGRLDHQVKLRGLRIELGEIETVLGQHPEVREAVVLVREDQPGTKRLAAYVTAAHAHPAVDDLRLFLRARLPEYMVPSAFVFLEALPLTPNGKVDRRALPVPDREPEAPALLRSPIEELLARLFAELLQLEQVGAETSFFEMGGHSLLATRLVARMREVFQVELPLRAVFEAPTVAELAAWVERERRAGAEVHMPPLEPAPRDRPLPLSFAQQRLWFLDRLLPGDSAYNVPVAVRLCGRLEVAPLAAALRELERRHEVLRTTFVESADGEPLQVIAPAPRLTLPVVDLRGLPESLRTVESHRLARREAAGPFDLARGPLLRVVLVATGERDQALLLTVHHIVCDGWSMGILIRELTMLYRAFDQGLPSPLPDLPLQYADFAVWQRRWLADDVLAAEIGYWREQMAGAPPILELPLDRPRPAVATAAGGRLPFALEEDLLAQLQKLARGHNVTLFMVLLAGFQLLLGRLSDQDDVNVATPVAGRDRVGTEALIGFFVNTLVLRARLALAAGFDDLLAQIRELAIAAYSHQQLPFEKLVEELQPVRDLAYPPLVQVMLALQNVPFEPVQLPDLLIEAIPASSGAVKLDLMLVLTEGAGRLGGTLEYRRDLFDATTLRRWLDSYRALLAAAAADPRRPLAELPLLSAAEQHQLVEWNDRRSAYPEALCTPELIGAQVRRTPDAVAASCGEEWLSYGALDARTGRLAELLAARGVRTDSAVALLGQRGLDLLTAILAVMKAGGAYVPLDPAHPAARHRQLLVQSGVRLVLVESRLAAGLGAVLADLPAGERPRVLVLEEALARPEPAGRLPLRSLPQSLAYVIYTSGSTGVPKGAMVEHRGMLNHLWAKITDLGLGPASTVAQTASQCFDISVWQLLAPLLVGGRVDILGDGTAHDPERLFAAVARRAVTVLEVVPSLLHALLDGSGWAASPAAAGLEWLLVTGEAFPADLAGRWLALCPQVPLLNAYGPTECSDDVTHHAFDRLPATPAAPALRVPIGRPVANFRLWVLDRGARPVPPGVAGELHVAGDGVGRGYLGDPVRTAQAFVPDPLGETPGSRLYRTGDLARHLPDGTLDFLGRVDHQVKVRGFRIELGEIEAVLGSHPGVREAVVLARSDQPGGLQLVGYFVPREQGARMEEVRAFLQARLPEYMVPAAFVVLDGFPLLPSGKIDRRTLPAPAAPAPVGDEAPRSPLGELLAAIFAEVLQVERVGPSDDFFAHGGHSLLATRVLSRVRATCGVELPVGALFETPTVAGLAVQVERVLKSGAVPRPPLLRETRGPRPPLSFAQQRLWLIDQIEPWSTAYVLPFAVQLAGPLDPATLAASLSEVVRRHETLRTTFASEAGVPWQVIAPARPLPLPRVDLLGLPPSAREAEVRRLRQAELRRPFDLARGPLLRAQLLATGEAQHLLLLTLHHILTDGWSMGVLVREVGTLYGAFAAGRPSPLPDLEAQYADYAVWQRSWLAGEALESEIAYWRRQLADAPPLLDLPIDRPRPAVRTFRGAYHPFALSPAVTRGLQEVSRTHRSTLFITVLAAFQTLLARYTGQTDIAIGTPIAGRPEVQTERLIGFFLNTLVLRTDLAGDPRFSELLERARKMALDAYAHQDLPFEKLVDELHPERALSHTPFFQALFVLQNWERPAVELPGLALSSLEMEVETTKFDLTLNLSEDPRGLRGSLFYGTEVFDRTTIARLLGNFAILLEGIAANPGRRLADLPLLGEAERSQLVCQWNDTGGAAPGACLHALFEARAAAAPDRVAVVFAGSYLTYGELAARSSRLAHALRGRGVAPGSIVALYMERSPDMMVALFAILKAGAAYLPIEPSTPWERVDVYLRDSAACVLLTKQWLADPLPAPPIDRWRLDADWDRFAHLPAHGPRDLATPADAAYLIYTSGSTGTPKAVVVEHRQIVNHLTGLETGLGLRWGTGFAAVQPLAVDGSKSTVYLSLVGGGTLYLISEETALDAQALAEELERHAIDGLKIAPSHLAALQAAGRPEAVLPRRWLIFGGEASRCEWALELADRAGAECTVTSNYGPTETTVGMLTCRIEPGLSCGPSQTTPLGRPMPGTRAYLLGRELQLVPVGAPGEIFIGGAGLARGYHGRPELTAERFVPDPFADAPGSRLYKTGDLARRLRDGVVEFLGRTDQQVKIRGFRIELGEVEAALGRLPGVSAGLAAARADRSGAQHLVGYIVPRGEEQLTAAQLQEALRETLPAHMIPSRFVFLKELPRAAQGKVNRKALPPPDDAPDQDPSSAPRNAVERTLAGVWSDLLGVARIGVHDNFFALGGDSILGIQIVARARQAGLHFTPKQLFEHQTVATLARVVRTAGELPARAAPRTSGGEVPLTPSQRRFFARELPHPEHFNQALLLEIRPPRPGARMEPSLLRRAAASLAEHHEVFRLRFEPSAEPPGWRQLYGLPEAEPPVCTVDLAGLAPALWRGALESAAGALQGSLDLRAGPLYRLALFRAGDPSGDRLLWIVHHLIVDGVSWRILLEDLELLYGQLVRGEMPALPPPSASFEMWALRLADHAASIASEADDWLRRLAGPVPVLPAGDREGTETVADTDRVAIALDAEETSRLLKQVPAVYRTRIEEVLLTALLQAFAAWTGSPRLLLDLEGHGRGEILEDLDVSRTVGWFTAVFPVRLDLGGETAPGEALKRVKEQLRAVPGRGVGFGLLRFLHEGEAGRALRALPRADVIFNYLGQLDQSVAEGRLFRPAGESAGPVQHRLQPRSHPLEIQAGVQEGRLLVAWSYSRRRHERAALDGLAQSFLAALRGLIDHCLSPGAGGYTPSDFPLAGIDQAALDRLTAGGEIADLYPASPLQQGLLFHALHLPESGIYVQQLRLDLGSELDGDCFERAWQQLVDRHPVLRTAFAWIGLPEPLQVVRSQVALAWNRPDWSDLSAAAREERWGALLEEDRRRGFDLSVPPLMRCHLIWTGPRGYRFLWSHHHALLDGWSLPLLLRELFALYEAARRAEPVRLEPAPSFRTYIAWLRGKGREEAAAEEAAAESFWRRTLAGFSSPTPLGIDRSVPAPLESDQGSRGVRWMRLSGERLEALQSFGRRQEVTLNTVVQGAWALLLQHYSGAEDVVFGAVTSGRSAPVPEIERMVGLFINTLPVRVDRPSGLPLAAWLREVQRRQAELRQLEHIPLPRIHGWSEVPRNQPLFESILVFENYPVDRSVQEQAGRALHIDHVETFEQPHYPLTIMIVPGGLLSFKVLYDRSRLTGTAIDRLLQHLDALLANLPDFAEAEPAAVPFLTSAERHQLVAEWNDTRTETCPALVHELFEDRVARVPEAAAVICGGEVWSYARLNAAANRLAHRLRLLGVAPGDLVAVLFDRSAEMIVALLGILKAGGAYVPLETRAPADRMRWILEEMEVAVAVAGSSRLAAIAAIAELAPSPSPLRHVVCLGELPGADAPAVPGARLWGSADLDAMPETDPVRVNRLDDLAYVIFTSGSTGRPKGVMERHRPVANLIDWVNRTFGVGPGDRVLFITSLGFDLSVYDVFGLLAAGGTIRVAVRQEIEDPRLLAHVLASERITFWDSAPAALAQLAPLLPQAVAAGDGGSLRLVFLSGDWIPLDLPDQVRASFPAAQVVSLGGATEATVWSNFHRVQTVDPLWRSIPYGRPIQNARYHILDDRFDPCPIGVPGDLYIGGECLSSGYAAAPLLTARQYLPDPFAGFAGRPGAILYRTGDRARCGPDGTIEFLGRLDHQVKIRGFRIELGEIEATLSQHPEVARPLVVVREDRPGERRLVAYLVPVEGARPQGAELRPFLEARLPEYMVPTAFVLLDALPLTANGKIDRKALPAPETQAHGRQLVAPRTATEEVLARIWREVLRRDRVSVDDNFFELGGDSILSIQVISRAAAAGLVIDPRQVFEHPTVAALAREARASRPAEPDEEPQAGEVPLTPIQRWFFEQELPSPEHFNQALLLEVRRPEPERSVDASLMRRALQHLFVHHDALRLRFAPPTGERPEWRQSAAAPSPEPPFTWMDLSVLPAERRRPALESAAAALQTSLDLEAGPLARVVLFGLGEGGERLLWIAHHLAVDGVSWRILLEDLESLYRQLASGQTVALPPRTASFRRWAARLVERAASPEIEAAAGGWIERLERAPRRLPLDVDGAAPSAVATSRTSRRITVQLTVEETRALLQEVPRAYRTRIDEVLLTALVEAFAPWTGERRLLVDLEGHGRGDLSTDLDLSRTVGWLTSLTPVLLDLEAAAAPGASLKSAKEQLRGLPGDGTGWGLLRHLHGGPAGARIRALPRAEVLFNYLGQLDAVVAAERLFGPAAESPGPGRAGAQPRSHLLEINGGVQGSRLGMSWTYGEGQHRRSTIEELAGRFVAALRELIDHCLAPGAGGPTPSDFPLARIDQATLDRMAAVAEIEDLYPAAAAQQGILFHALEAPGSGVYVEQLNLTLGSDLDVQAFEEAWRRVVERHAILRTAFAWEGLGEPHQVVWRRIDLPWSHHDWSGLSAEERGERWAACLDEDRRRGFAPGTAPLLRFLLVRMGEEGYRFLWSHHHLLLDGWSIPLLVREVFALYAAARDGGEASVGEVRPYRDYIAWLGRQDPGSAEAFWRRALAGFSRPTRLAVERRAPDPGTGGRRNAALRTRLSSERMEALRGFAQRLQVTLNTLVQGAWALLLQRYSGEPDVVFGAVTSGRSAPVPGIEEMLGVFINTLPVRVTAASRGGLAAWLRDLQDLQVEMRRYEHIAISRVHAWSGLPRERALFDTIMVFENYPVDRAMEQQVGRSLQILDVEMLEYTNYPLELVVVPGIRLDLKLVYDRRHFGDAGIGRMLRHLDTILEGWVAAPPEADPSSVPMLSAAERHQVLREWNDTAAVGPASLGSLADIGLHELVAAQAERVPEAVAAVFDGESLTYRELEESANRLARRLIDLGVRPDDRVGVLLERSLEMIVALLGVLKAGAAYLPLDPSLPAGRLALVTESSGASVVLDRERLAGLLRPSPSDLLSPPRALPSGRGGEGLAYVIYTSGSTGTPKGVMIPHAGIVNRLLWMQEAYGLTPEDRVLQKTPFGFDVSVWEFFWPLLTGARLVFARPEGHKDPAYLMELIAQEGITTLHFVPSMLQAFLEAPGLEPLSGLRRVMASGEALPPDLVRRFFQQLPGVELHNLYGPTEASVDVSFWPCVPEPPRAVVPIGRPIANLRLYVADRDLAPQPVGVPGELLIGGRGGVGLARGYLGRPELTAAAFVPDPFANEPGSRLYRTGDLTCLLPDGNIEYLGRLDHQVKIRGFRIELGEIEAALASHPAVREAVVLAREDQPGQIRLVAYITGDATAEELRRSLGERLPNYMLPAAFMTLTALPLTGSGKVDRKALPAPEQPVATSRSVAPRNQVEKDLAAIWEEILGVHPIGVRDDFFASGGHSLLALQLAGRIARHFGRELTLLEIVTARTVEALAAKLASAPAPVDGSPLVVFRSTGEHSPFFCVHPGGGRVAVYQEVSEHLGADLPFYALQSRGVESDETPLATVEEMADLYLASVVEVQPAGPYRLGGWSFGGLVAFEMACRLRREGQDVSVFLLDTPAPGVREGVGQNALELLEEFMRDAGARVEGLDLAQFDDDAVWEEIIRRTVETGLLPEAHLRRWLGVSRANFLAGRRYRPEPAAVPVALLRASEPVSEEIARLARESPDYGWSRFTTAPVAVLPVPGNHGTMMRAGCVEDLAAVLAQALRGGMPSVTG